MSINPASVIPDAYAVALLQRSIVNAPERAGMAGSQVQARGTVVTRRDPKNDSPVVGSTSIAAQLAL